MEDTSTIEDTAIDSEIFQMEYNDTELEDIMLQNISKMVSMRTMWISVEPETVYEQFSKHLKNGTTFFEGDRNIAVKFINRKLSTIAKVDDVETFLKQYSSYHKIVVFQKLTPKAINQFIKYDNLELVKNEDVYVDRSSYILSQKVVLLSPEDQAQALLECKAGRGDMQKMRQYDKVVHYYQLKLGEVVRIERPSINTGISIIYRQVAASQLFD
jgi:DNA-directed RNA polymerase subunit H (RpoH/RPB5)